MKEVEKDDALRIETLKERCHEKEMEYPLAKHSNTFFEELINKLEGSGDVLICEKQSRLMDDG